MDQLQDDRHAEQLRWADALVRLFSEHFPGHPAVAWYVGITNGIPEPGLPTPSLFHRFRRGRHAAYVWVDDDGAWVSPWHPECQHRRTVQRAESIAAALDFLAATLLPRPWWRFWR